MVSGGAGSSGRAAPIDGGGDASWTESVRGDASGETTVIFSTVVDGNISGACEVTVGRGNGSASFIVRDSGEPASAGFIDCSSTGVGLTAGCVGSAGCHALLGGTWFRFADTGITELPAGIVGSAVGVVIRVVGVVGVIEFIDGDGFDGIGVEAMTAGCETMAGCNCGIGCIDDIGCVGDTGAAGIADVLV